MTTALKTRVVERDPNTLRLLDVNARYMRKEQYDALVANLKRDGALTSAVTIWEDRETGDEIVLSGNHRTMASREVGLPSIPCLLIENDLTEQQRIAIQLSHNAIVGEDDPATLKQLYEALDQIEWRDYSGLDDATLELLDKVDVSSLSEANLDFATVQITFLPPELEAATQSFEEARKMTSADERWIAAYADYDRMLAAIEDTRGAHGIGNLAVALGAMLSVFERHITDLKEGWLDPETNEARDPKKWVPLASIFGRSLPAGSGAIIEAAIRRATQRGDVAPDQPWQALEQWAADYLAGE